MQGGFGVFLSQGNVIKNAVLQGIQVANSPLLKPAAFSSSESTAAPAACT